MQSPIEEKLQKKQSLVFYTHAPQGTLGDPSAAAKLIKDLKERNGASLELSIILIVEPEHEKKVCDLFKDLDVTLLTMSNLVLPDAFDDYPELQDKAVLCDKILRGTNGLIFFPTFHKLIKEDLDYLLGYNKPYFIITEYDLIDTNQDIQNSLLGDAAATSLVINTGFGSNAKGIFCTQEQNTSNNKTALSEISSETDRAFCDLLYHSQDPNNYHQEHQLFLGYYNQLDMEYDGSPVNPMLFIESGLATVSKDTNVVDFVIPFKTESDLVSKTELNLENTSDSNNESKEEPPILRYKSKETICEYFVQNPKLVEDYLIEFWKKHTSGVMECVERRGEGKKLLRFINGFPFTPNTMDKLMKASNELVLVTGDQTLSEAISHEKIPIYQTMDWKSELFENLIDVVKSGLGEKSVLLDFLYMQHCAAVTDRAYFVKTLLTDKENLIADAKALRSYILKHKNLYKNLSIELMEYLRSPRKYFYGCLNNNIPITPRIIEQILRKSPNTFEVLFDSLRHLGKIKVASYCPNSNEHTTFSLALAYCQEALEQNPDQKDSIAKIRAWIKIYHESYIKKAKHYLNTIKPGFKNVPELTNLTAILIVKIFSENTTQQDTLSQIFIKYLKQVDDNTLLTSTLIKALYFLSVRRPVLDDISFLNKANAELFATAFESKFIKKTQPDFNAIEIYLKELTGHLNQSTPSQHPVENNLLVQSNKKNKREEETADMKQKKESKLS